MSRVSEYNASLCERYATILMHEQDVCKSRTLIVQEIKHIAESYACAAEKSYEAGTDGVIVR